MQEDTYSPFWICLIVFAAILVANIFQLTLQKEQCDAINAARQNVAQTATKYRLAQARIEALAKDLVELAKTNDNAKKVVTEFNIRLNAASLMKSPAAASSAPAPAAPVKKK